MDGFLYINKEKDWTSCDVCNKIQSMFHLKKVGHIGTLDPFATGLLIVTLGKGTKAGRFLEDASKEYIATLVLGKKTSSGDLTGEVVQEKEIPELSLDKIKQVFASFIGEYHQIPPMTSAIKIDGVKLYSLAHQGLEIKREPRQVWINSLELLSFKDNVIEFKANVSKGTYIRTLGEDIAEKLNTVGYLSSLTRTKIGDASITESKKISDIKETDLISITQGLSYLHPIVVEDKDIERIKSGVSLRFDKIKNCDIIFLVDKNNNPLAIYERSQNDVFKCLRGLW